MFRGKPAIHISLENRKALKPGCLYTRKELGEILRLSGGSLTRVVSSGLIKYSTVGKSLRFSSDDIQSFLDKSTKVIIID